MLMKLWSFALAFTLSLAQSAIAQCGPRWIYPEDQGVNGDVNALLVWNRASTGTDLVLVAAGGFTMAGGKAFNRIAAWNGQTWESLGDGFDGTVQALVNFNGKLVAGGSFSKSGSTTVNGLAAWNPQLGRWVALGPSLTPKSGETVQVNAFAVSSDSLFVGGRFANAGSLSVSNVAWWTSSGWRALHVGLSDDVNSLANDSTLGLIAGGSFTFSGTTSANRVARFDFVANRWRAMSTGFNGKVLTLNNSFGTIYAGGAFTQTGTTSLNRIARWDSASSSWKQVGSGFDGTVRALGAPFLYNGGLFAVGEFSLSGTVPVRRAALLTSSGSWAQFGDGLYGDALCLSGWGESNVVIAGRFLRSDSRWLSRIAWSPKTEFTGDTRRFVPLGLEPAGVLRALSKLNGSLHVAGDSISSAAHGSGTAFTSLLRWTGSQFDSLAQSYRLGSWPPSTTIVAEHGEVIIAGTTTPGGYSTGWLGQIDGQSWGTLAAFDISYSYAAVPHMNGRLPGPWSIASQGDRLFVGGAFSSLTPRLGSIVGSYGGVAEMTLEYNSYLLGAPTWKQVGSGFGEAAVHRLIEYQGSLYAIGWLGGPRLPTPTAVARYNGVDWDPIGVGGPTNGYATSAAIVNDELVMVGPFRQLGSTDTNHVAAWNGTSWRQIGGGLLAAPGQQDFMARVVPYRTGFVVQGPFTRAGNVAVNGIAFWDGAQWQAIQNSLQGQVSDIFSSGDELWLSGEFLQSDGMKQSSLEVFTATGAPSIASHPVDAERVIGQDAEFRCSAGNWPVALPVLSYRWRRDGQLLEDDVRIHGSHTNILTIKDVKFSDVGQYDCVLSNSCAAATSDRARLTVRQVPPAYLDSGRVDITGDGTTAEMASVNPYSSKLTSGDGRTGSGPVRGFASVVAQLTSAPGGVLEIALRGIGQAVVDRGNTGETNIYVFAAEDLRIAIPNKRYRFGVLNSSTGSTQQPQVHDQVGAEIAGLSGTMQSNFIKIRFGVGASLAVSTPQTDDTIQTNTLQWRITLTPSCPADFNADGFVDDADFSLFVVQYDLLDCSDPGLSGNCFADLNGDGVVNDADFGVFVFDYSNVLCPP